jgi:hypothetical protein
MKAVRQVVAVTLVATALCADRVVASAPHLQNRPEPQTARSLVGRLSVSFRRVVPTVRLVETRRDQEPMARVLPVVIDQPVIMPLRLSPFQFRLPPPVR